MALFRCVAAAVASAAWWHGGTTVMTARENIFTATDITDTQNKATLLGVARNWMTDPGKYINLDVSSNMHATMPGLPTWEFLFPPLTTHQDNKIIYPWAE